MEDVESIKGFVRQQFNQLGIENYTEKDVNEYTEELLLFVKKDTSAQQQKLVEPSLVLSPNVAVYKSFPKEEVSYLESPVGHTRKVCHLSQSSISLSDVSCVSEDPHQFQRQCKSFIRPSNIKRVVSSNSDPVKRYQQYRSVWERQPAPGEVTHSALRWHVREKMLEGPSTRPIKKSAAKVNSYVVPTSKKRQQLCWDIRTQMAEDS